MLNPDEKMELTTLLRQQLQNVQTDNWRDENHIEERLRDLMTRWRREKHALGTH